MFERWGSAAWFRVGDSTWSLRVHSTDDGRANVYTRQHQFAVGAALPFDVRSEQISALEYVLGAVGADVAVGLRSLARRRRVAVDEVEAVVSGRLDNALTHLGVVGETGHPGLVTITVRVFVASDVPPTIIRQLWDEVLARSPLVNTFRAAVQLDLSVEIAL